MTLVIILVLPRLTTAGPAPLVAIVVVTAIVMIAGLDVPNVGDQGPLTGRLPGFTPMLAPVSLETLSILCRPP